MKPVALIRRENLRRLIDEEFDGNGAALAARLGKNRRNGTKQVSAWLNHKAMRDETARAIERACMKPSGWLDHEGKGEIKGGEQPSQSSHYERTDRRKMADAIRLLQEVANIRGFPEMVTDPNCISVAYDFLVEFDTPLTESNVLDMTKRVAAALRGETDADRSKEGPEAD
jgi:hypothetical protein